MDLLLLSINFNLWVGPCHPTISTQEQLCLTNEECTDKVVGQVPKLKERGSMLSHKRIAVRDCQLFKRQCSSVVPHEFPPTDVCISSKYQL